MISPAISEYSLRIVEMLSFLQIVQILFVAVCLLLKTDMVIGFQTVAVFDIEHEPLDAVPDKEG